MSILHGEVNHFNEYQSLYIICVPLGKTYVGALLNTTEQNWAPPRYKSDVRSIKANHNRDHQLTSIPSSNDSTERILRNGKRRGSSTTVTPSSTTKSNSFKIPERPATSSKLDDAQKRVARSSTNINDEDEKILVGDTTNGGDEDIGDNYSSRSVSPTTSGTSTTSSSPPLPNPSSIPIDLSNSKANINVEQNTNDTLIPYDFTNNMVNPSNYFSSLHGSTNSFSLPSFNRLSSQSPSSSYLPIPSQLYFNSLTIPHYPSVSSFSKSSH